MPFDLIALALLLSFLALLAPVLLWVPFLGKILYAGGKIIRIFGFIVGALDAYALFLYLTGTPPPF